MEDIVVAKEKLDSIVDSCRSLSYMTFMEVVEDANFILELLKRQQKRIEILESLRKLEN